MKPRSAPPIRVNTYLRGPPRVPHWWLHPVRLSVCLSCASDFLETGKSSELLFQWKHSAGQEQQIWDVKIKDQGQRKSEKIVFGVLYSSKVDRFTSNQNQNDHRSMPHICRRIHFTARNASFLWYVSVNNNYPGGGGHVSAATRPCTRLLSIYVCMLYTSVGGRLHATGPCVFCLCRWWRCSATRWYVWQSAPSVVFTRPPTTSSCRWPSPTSW